MCGSGNESCRGIEMSNVVVTANGGAAIPNYTCQNAAGSAHNCSPTPCQWSGQGKPGGDTVDLN